MMTADEMRDALSSHAVPVPVLAQVLGITPHLAYRAVKAGEFESIKIGRSIRVPTAPLRRKLGLEDQARAA